MLVEFILEALGPRAAALPTLLLGSAGDPKAAAWESGSWDLEALVEMVAVASGADGKADPEERIRLACSFVLRRFRAGGLGRYTLDRIEARVNNSTDVLHEETGRLADARGDVSTRSPGLIPGRASASVVGIGSGLSYNPRDVF